MGAFNNLVNYYTLNFNLPNEISVSTQSRGIFSTYYYKHTMIATAYDIDSMNGGQVGIFIVIP